MPASTPSLASVAAVPHIDAADESSDAGSADDESNKISNDNKLSDDKDEEFYLNMRQTMAAKREQLVEDLDRAKALLNGDYTKAWSFYNNVFKLRTQAEATKAAAQRLPDPARGSRHDINNALADRIWREESSMDANNAPFGYVAQLEAHDAKKAKKAETAARKAAAKSANAISAAADTAPRQPVASARAPIVVERDADDDIDDKMTAAEAPIVNAIVVTEDSDDEDVDDARDDVDVMYVTSAIDGATVVLDAEYNVQVGAVADSAAEANFTVEQGVDFWREHAAVYNRPSHNRTKDSDHLVDKLFAERSAASRLRRIVKQADLPAAHKCPTCGKYYGTRPEHEQRQHANKCANKSKK